jgi:DNA-directed RNA polymerase subunit E'/Rpb7
MNNSNQINNSNEINNFNETNHLNQMNNTYEINKSNNNEINKSNNNEIYFNNVLIKRICIKAKYLNENIDEYINNYLKSNIEGKCIDEGYVEPNSIKIIKKSIGTILGSRFTGDVTYDIIYTANVCNPVSGNIINCKVKFINKLGILGTNGPITITIPKQLHKNSDFENININDNIKIEVIAKKYSLNQKEIKIVAKLFNVNDNDTKKKSFTTKKKDELISSDLTPILYENENDYDETLSNQEQENSDNENEELSFDDTDLLESDEELNSDEEIEDVKIKMENPDENNLEMDDIDIEDEVEDEDDNEDEDEESSIDYD